MADAPDLGSGGATRGGSSPPSRTIADYRIGMFTQTLKQARRTAIGVVGGTIIAIGIAMLLTPGPGWLVIFIGLSVLGIEFAWARRLMRQLKRRGSEIGTTISEKVRKAQGGSASETSDRH
jgi:uncharacterized protein (TIGR02611 family)